MIVLTFFTLYFFLAHAQNSTSCQRSCGNNVNLQYPFGFSHSCKIRLHCHENKTMKIGEFEVKQVSSDNILLHFPANCSRHVDETHQFIGSNYAPTPRNNFLIKNCTQPVNNCSIQAESFQDRLSLKTCKSKDDGDDDDDDDVSCYSEKNTSGVNELQRRTTCSSLFTSILINLNKSVDSVVLALEFELVELEWWLQGPCKCAKDAKCVNVSVVGGNKGFRCQCKAGFQGNGFRDGGGCRRG